MAFRDYSKTPADNTELGDGTYIGPDMLRNKVRPALQQLAADGKELADRAEGLIALGKGDPGGTPQAIGLFTAAAIHLGGDGFEIPTGIDMVATTGYSALDVGAALYVYDASVEASYVTANPRLSFLSTNGRGFRLAADQEITLGMFGARGDNLADDTASWVAGAAYIAATGKNVLVDKGTYLVDAVVLNGTTYGTQGNFFGLDRERTILKRRTSGPGAFVTVGDSGGTIFQSGLIFEGIQIDGGATTNGPAVRCYDVVRSQFRDCLFNGGSYAVHLFGGIMLSFDDCVMQNAARGVQIEKFSSLAGGGYPNRVRLTNCEVVDNSEWGIWFDYGRLLVLDGCQVENNGTTLGAAQGGLYVGSHIGEEITINDPQSQGILIEGGSWFEANKGIADIHLNSGINVVADAAFFSTSTQSTNDIRVDGGRYLLRNLNSSFSKTANLLEGAGVAPGNLIEACELPNITWNPAKTKLDNATATSLPGSLALFPPASITPGTNGQMTWQLTNNTTLVIKVKGSDGTVRSNTLTLS